MGRLTRVSKSQVLRELLEAAEPGLRRAVALMDAASKAPAELRAGLAERIDENLDRLEKGALSELSRLEGMTGDLISQSEAIRGRRPKRSAADARSGPQSSAKGRRAPQNPPASNRGVKSKKTGRQAVKRGHP
jgi:hypothetical protein